MVVQTASGQRLVVAPPARGGKGSSALWPDHAVAAGTLDVGAHPSGVYVVFIDFTLKSGETFHYLTKPFGTIEAAEAYTIQWQMSGKAPWVGGYFGKWWNGGGRADIVDKLTTL